MNHWQPAVVLLLTVSWPLFPSDTSVSAQCLQEAGKRDPPFLDDNGNNVLISGTQAIIPTYTFNCCANITGWQTWVQPGGGGHNGEYSIAFQVWRQLTNDSQCYSLVGQNIFSQIELERDGEVRETVASTEQISVEPGNIVGLFVRSENGGNEGIQLDESEEFNNNLVWFDESDLPSPCSGSCEYKVGDTGQIMESRAAAPMLNVTLTQFPCPSTESTATLEPTSTTASELRATTDITLNATLSMSINESISLPEHVSAATTTASDITEGGSEIFIVGIVAGVAVLVVAMVAASVAFVVCFIIWKKRASKRENKNLELSNPNYVYEAGKTRNNLDCSPGGTLYHVVGPQVGTPQSTEGNAILSSAYNIPPAEKLNGRKLFGDIYDEPLSGLVTIYDDPTRPNFRQNDSSSSTAMFERVGYYVPTLEQRSAGDLKLNESNPSAFYNKLNFFVEDQIYWAPATTASGLYSQLASKKYREILRCQIRLQDSLGSGQFGEVYKAIWSIDQQQLELAVKTLKAGASEEDKVKFLQEAAIMGQFSHNNVIKMYGVVTVGEPVFICAEILENGDLRSYLRKLDLKDSKQNGLQMTFLSFAKEIAAGMEYLSGKSFVHRDLAARNILLNKFLTCKISDFGMARDLMDDTYYTSSGGKIPVKWTAPEALIYRKYSTDSDVWSFGMLLYEIWSIAKKPFSGLSNNQVIRLTETGFCQSPPPGCPRAIYHLMVDCWNPDHQSRPSFKSISQGYLHQPSDVLLHWSTEDNCLSSKVGVCGAPLQHAHKLYNDLQMKYESYRRN